MHSNNDPLHGVTLKKILETLVEHYGWPALGQRVRINCFNTDPSINSSLKFLRKTPWARKQVEQLFVENQKTSTNIWPEAPPSKGKR